MEPDHICSNSLPGKKFYARGEKPRLEATTSAQCPDYKAEVSLLREEDHCPALSYSVVRYRGFAQGEGRP